MFVLIIRVIINDMNRNNQRKIQPTVRIIEHEKQANSDLQSLLVSSVRYDTVLNSQAQSHVVDLPQSPSPIMGSLIKKNRSSNVYIQQSPHCNCQQNTESLNNCIKLLTLKLQQLQVKLNICFGKQASIQSQITDSSNKQELFSQKQWEIDLKIKEQNENIAKLKEQSWMQFKENNEDLIRLKKIIIRLEGKQSEKCRDSKLLQHRLQKYKEEQNSKLNCMLQTMQEIGNLQRKILSDSQVRPHTFPDQSCSFALPYEMPNPKKMKILKACTISHKPTCQSTNISYSRNIETSK